jgi:hypothetical protein
VILTILSAPLIVLRAPQSAGLLRLVSCLSFVTSLYQAEWLLAEQLPDPATNQPQVVATESSVLKIDPLLMVYANTVWEILSTNDNPIWPGWNATSTPILFYLPGVQDVLLNHTNPPEGFVPYTGPVRFAGGQVMLRNGDSLIDWDGQNTSREINGVRTLVVADTLSNRKQWLSGVLHDSRSVDEKLKTVDYFDMSADPYRQMTLITHEAFHVFQNHMAPDKGANEMDVRLYPCLSVKNNVGAALEGIALAECLRAEDLAKAREAAIEWLAVRQKRRADLSPEAIAYEDGNEFSEGLAVYTEMRLAQVLQGRQAPDQLWLVQGFRGFSDLTHMRNQLIKTLLDSTQGSMNINNDRYGTAPVRFRLYYSGMAIAAMLDRFDSNWKERIFANGVSLTDLATAALEAEPSELKAALATVMSGPQYEELVATKRQLEIDGNMDTATMLQAIDHGTNTTLVIDYRDLGDVAVRLAFTPFGVRAVDENRTIYTLVPIQAGFSSDDYSFAQSTPTATLEDRSRKTFRFQLNEKVDVEELNKVLSSDRSIDDPIDALDVVLGGVKVKAKRAVVEHRGDVIQIRYLASK